MSREQSVEQLSQQLQEGIREARVRIDQLRAKQRTLFIAVVGGAVCGKTSLISPSLAKGLPSTVTLSEDNYCIGNTASTARHGKPHLHTPKDYEPDRIRRDLLRLRNGQTANTPIYDFNKREPRRETYSIDPSEVVIMEGAYLLQDHLRELFDIGIFVDTNDHDRLIRRLLRPRRNQRQSDGERLRDYATLSYPSYYQEIAPTKASADIVFANPYSPSEAVRLLASSSIASLDETVEGSITIYTHSAMSPTEQLSVCVDGNDIQHLQYEPGIILPAFGLNFSIASEEYRVDLSRVGYEKLPG